jgi:hypothetical protein
MGKVGQARTGYLFVQKIKVGVKSVEIATLTATQHRHKDNPLVYLTVLKLTSCKRRP